MVRVDINKYNFTQIPESNLSFLLVSRLLGEKGLREYAEAAKIVKENFQKLNLKLLVLKMIPWMQFQSKK